MSLAPIPTTTQITDGRGRVESTYQSWFASIQKWLAPVGAYGPTAKRPATNLWIGQPYFDTDLGYIVHIKSLNPTVWVNGAGTSV